MAYRKVDEASLTAVADSIREKGGTTGALAFPDGFVSAVQAIQAGGGGGSSIDDVTIRFVDFDGNQVYVSTPSTITQLPTVPEPYDSRLEVVRWSKTIDEIKAAVSDEIIFPLYKPSDGKTHIFLSAKAGVTYTLYVRIQSDTLTTDWGDGTDATTVTGSGSWGVSSQNHTYINDGDYEIVIIRDGDTGANLGSGASSHTVLQASSGYANVTEIWMGAATPQARSYSLQLPLLRRFVNGGDDNYFYDNMIGDGTFSNVRTIRYLRLDSRPITSIGNNAFENCQNLALTSLPDGLTSIGSYAFSECTNLALTSLPDVLTSIGRNAFYNCPNLALTSLPNGLTSIGSYAFYNCTNLALTSLPNGLTSIENNAFYNCPNLALTSLPNGLTSIRNAAFSGCTNLALTSLPNGLTSIAYAAFSGCTNLALTSLPDGLTSIEDYAFQRCIGLTTITFEGTPTGKISSTAFATCTNLTTINVPWAEGAVANAPWGATSATINYNYTGE